jgi:outer membrane protein assembly factor BamA
MVSCNVGKYIPENKYLLNKNIYVLDQDSLSEEEYKTVSSVLSAAPDYAQQQPNTRVLGVRLGMRIYCLSNPNKKNWLNNIIRKQGSEPVIFDNMAMHSTAKQLKLLLDTKGCFNSEVDFQTDTLKGDRINVTYRVYSTPRYTIDSVAFSVENTDVRQLLEKENRRCLIKKGNYYDQNVLVAERERVVNLLQNNGYYTASKEVVTFLLDTNKTNWTMKVVMNISDPKVFTSDQQLVSEPLKPYYINNIYIYPNLESLLAIDSLKKDTLKYDYNYRGHKMVYYFLVDKDMNLNKSVISRSIFLSPNELYRRRNVELTYNSLIGLRNFKFTNVEFFQSDKKSDSANFIDARIILMEAMRHSVSTSLEISNTSPLWMATESTNNLGNFGLEWALGYQNKNLFGGAELFNIRTTLLLELAKSALSDKEAGDFYSIFSAFETGLDMSIEVPKFIIPIPSSWFSKRFRPRTAFSLGFNYQFRTFFERALANTSFSYNWRNRATKQHQFAPLGITYVRFLNQSDVFKEQIDNLSSLRLKYQYSDHFIMNSHYTYAYTNQQINTKTNFTYFSFGAEVAGNVLYAIDKALDRPPDSSGIYSVLGVPYSQYVRTEMDLKHYFYLSNNNTFVARLMFGIGIPYGNSLSLPYEKSFYGGGPTTIRAWNIRTLGPGSYTNQSLNVFERVGDMMMVVNLEDRFHLFGIFEGAAFLDMGNIWLLRPSDEFPNGNFTFNSFLSDIAIGGGLGLRLNISIITLRLDFAIPFYDPQCVKGERWRFPYWRWNQVVTNFGIDYPF